MTAAIEGYRGRSHDVAAPTLVPVTESAVIRISLIEAASSGREFHAGLAQRRDESDTERHPEQSIVVLKIVIGAANFGTRVYGGEKSGFGLHIPVKTISIGKPYNGRAFKLTTDRNGPSPAERQAISFEGLGVPARCR